MSLQSHVMKPLFFDSVFFFFFFFFLADNDTDISKAHLNKAEQIIKLDFFSLQNQKILA